jgi:dCTP deaminase
LPLFPPSEFPELERVASQQHSTGVLPCQHIAALIDGGRISASEPITPGQIQPASLDLRLGSVAYRVQASFLPGPNHSVGKRVESLLMHELDLSSGAVLERGCVYISPLLEQLHLPSGPSGIAAFANAKSTTGRLDIFTRLIANYSTEFDRVAHGYRGPLFVEVVPRTFSVIVRQGTRLSQLRLVRGSPPPSDAALDVLHESEAIVYKDTGEAGDADIRRGLRLSLDLVGSKSEQIVGYRARKHAPVIDFGKLRAYDVRDYWEPLLPQPNRTLILDPDDFYILASKERVSVPPHYAASMVPYDPSVGEFRVHYAGFFDPGFGYGGSDVRGARAVLEVRSHDVPFMVEDGQTVGRLVYDRLLAKPEKSYGEGIGSSYQGQDLALAKQFRPMNTERTQGNGA